MTPAWTLNATSEDSWFLQIFSRISGSRKGPCPSAHHQPPGRSQSRGTHWSSHSSSAETKHAGSAPDAGWVFTSASSFGTLTSWFVLRLISAKEHFHYIHTTTPNTLNLSMHLFLCPRWTSFPSSPTGSPLLTTGRGIKTSGSQDLPAPRPQPDPSTVGPPPPKAPQTWDNRDADSWTPTPIPEAQHHPCCTTQGSHLLR